LLTECNNDQEIGYQLWMFCQDKDLRINVLKDEQLLNDRVWEAEKTGALVVGGGVSKRELSLGLFHDLFASPQFCESTWFLAFTSKN